jgi:hypothetical protein
MVLIKKMIYNPQGLINYGKIVSGIKDCKVDRLKVVITARKFIKESFIQEFTNYPIQILKFSNEVKQFTQRKASRVNGIL